MNIKNYLKSFSEININDVFFQSLKEDYEEFENWFNRKSKKKDEKAFVSYDEDEHITDFLYLKKEDGEVEDVTPVLPKLRRLKIGTFKIESRNSKRGEFFIKKIMDVAMIRGYKEIYATIYPKHEHLVSLLEKYGFMCKAYKFHDNGKKEKVLVKSMTTVYNDIIKDYPRINIKDNSKYILSIYPKYHSKMFPFSSLETEKNLLDKILLDVAPTNSLHKVYLSNIEGTRNLKAGDVVVIYRTKDKNRKSAYYSSVCTTLCVIEKNLTKEDFRSKNEMFDFIHKYNIFSDAEIERSCKKTNFRILSMLYNVTFPKKVILKELTQEIGIDRNKYLGFLKLTDQQFEDIHKKGEINEDYFIH